MKQKLFFPVNTEREKSLPYYVETVGINYRQEEILRENGLGDHQLLLCLDGTGTAFVNGSQIALKPGDVLFLEKNSLHDYHKTSDEWITDWITYNGYGVKQLSNLKNGVYNFENFDRIERIVKKIAYHGGNADWAVQSSALLYKLLLICKPEAGISANSSFSKMMPAVEYITENCGNDITLGDVANVLGVSNEHTCTLFKNALGMRPTEYINKVRIQKAKEMLVQNSDFSVCEIGSRCGFSSTSYFVLKFRKLTGTTPSEFRHLQSGR